MNNVLELRKQPKTNLKRLAWEREYNKRPKRAEYIKKYQELNKDRDNAKKRDRYHKLVKPKINKNSKVNYGLGKEGEVLALEMLNGSTFIGRPSDLSWYGKLIEVKTSIKTNYYTRVYKTLETKICSTFRWKFLLSQKGNVDYFFLVLKNKDKSVNRVLLIPDKDISCKNFQISESGLSKYDKYILVK